MKTSDHNPRRHQTTIEPYSVSGHNRYCRLFAPTGRKPPDYNSTEFNEKFLPSLDALVQEMDDANPTFAGPPQRYAIPAGYTYFGQFLDHDLTGDASSALDTWHLRPEEILNRQAPRLDLSHIYGKGPRDKDDRRLYDGIKLKVGAPIGSQNVSFDIAVDHNGHPLIADPRAAENLILRQLTAVFCRLHNLAVDQFTSDYGLDSEACFERARLHTCWQFQLLVYEDYLPTILDARVYRKVFLKRRPSVRWDTFSIPVEFSAAAMRFGHSMVQRRYFFLSRDFELGELMELGRRQAALEPEHEIDWGRFIQNASATGVAPVSASPIDTGLTPGLLRVPVRIVRLFNKAFLPPPIAKLSASSTDSKDSDGIVVPLPLLTFLRNAGLQLPYGQSVAEAFGENLLTEAQLTCNQNGDLTNQGRVLRRNNMVEKTPLWFYILKESELQSGGSWLGHTGSHIVAETIYQALLDDPNSILNHQGLDWCTVTAPYGRPGICRPIWEFRNRTGRSIRRSLADLRELLFYVR